MSNLVKIVDIKNVNHERHGCNSIVESMPTTPGTLLLLQASKALQSFLGLYIFIILTLHPLHIFLFHFLLSSKNVFLRLVIKVCSYLPSVPAQFLVSCLPLLPSPGAPHAPGEAAQVSVSRETTSRTSCQTNFAVTRPSLRTIETSGEAM